MQRRLIIIPRWSGRAGSDFYPWLQRELATLPDTPFAEVMVPELPDPDAPHPGTWPPAILAALGTDPELLARTVVLAHSVGCQATLHALAALPDGVHIAAMLAVAGWWQVDRPWPAIVPWQSAHPDLARVRAAVRSLLVLLSDDDPFTADHVGNAAMWQERLGAAVQLVPGAKHFNVPTSAPVLAALRTL
ncbi:MAG: alpha/beta hydrolase [Nannocystis sp.]|nr:alpha/beta hydrolase [Nannocystis sp.]MBA3545500.1 alpha/beta hydrolase [Nannocystis sp.]